jgi:hypothetical protein
MPSGRNRKCGKRFTEPDFPARTLVREGNVSIENFYRSHGDHAPPHLHLLSADGNVAIGQNGFPLEGWPELTSTQREFVDRHRKIIKKAIAKIGRWYWFHFRAEEEFGSKGEE